MDSDSFINSLIRFSARCGVPKRIRSDNGSNFVGGDKELRQSIDKWNQNHNLNQHMLLHEIDWIYNPPPRVTWAGVGSGKYVQYGRFLTPF
jgi:hypothetical protein